jgi:hypothetical protein
VRFAQKLAFGRKVSDEFTVPLCRLHHRELHRSRNELLWWKKARIDPIRIARGLWEATRPKAAPPQPADKLPTPSALPASPPSTDGTSPQRSAAKRAPATRDASAGASHP